jgi:hypothetical protein
MNITVKRILLALVLLLTINSVGAFGGFEDFEDFETPTANLRFGAVRINNGISVGIKTSDYFQISLLSGELDEGSSNANFLVGILYVPVALMQVGEHDLEILEIEDDVDLSNSENACNIDDDENDVTPIVLPSNDKVYLSISSIATKQNRRNIISNGLVARSGRSGKINFTAVDTIGSLNTVSGEFTIRPRASRYRGVFPIDEEDCESFLAQSNIRITRKAKNTRASGNFKAQVIDLPSF